MTEEFMPEQNAPMPNVERLESARNLYDEWRSIVEEESEEYCGNVHRSDIV